MLAELLDIVDGLKEAFRGKIEGFYAAQFGKPERIQFYESLMGVLEDSIPIEEALETVEKAFSNGGRDLHPVSIICNEVAMGVRGGKTLADACRARFPNDETSLIQTGEDSGDLVQAFRDCVRIIEVRQQIGRLVASVVLLPSLTWSLMWVLLYVIALWLVPSMSRRDDPENWTGIPALLHMLSYVVSHYGVFIVITVVMVIITSILTLPYFCGLKISPTSPMWKIQLSRILQSARIRLEGIPPWSIYKTLQGSVFLLNMSVMLRAGINQNAALDTLKRSATPWLRERLDAIRYGVSAGKNFGEALKLAGHQFPDPMAIHFLEVLSAHTGFAASMERFANRWLDQMLKRVDAMAKTMIALSAVCMGSLMILVVIGVFMLAGNATESSGF